MAHPHLQEARDGAAAKLRRIAGFHGTPRNPSGNDSPDGTSGGGKFMAERPGEVISNGPQPSLGLASLKAEGKRPKRNLGKFARGGRTKGKGKGTTVNVMISPSPSSGGPPPMMPPQALPMPRPAGPPPGPAGMPGAAPPPGLPPGAIPPRPGMPPPGMMPHRSGGRAFKRGGAVAPQYPQKVKTAHKQDLSSEGYKRGGKAKKYADGGPLPAAQPPVQMSPQQLAQMSNASNMQGKMQGLQAGRMMNQMRPPQGMAAPAMPQSNVPPGMGLRKHGGKVKRKDGGRTYDAGSITGEGRIEKIKAYGNKAHTKAKSV